MGLAGRAILVAGTITVYWGTLTVPLLFDDQLSITRNLSIRSLWPIWPALTPPNDAGAGGRPFLNLSYALNYAFGGTGVFGYHLVNLTIHVLAALTLFGLVRRTLLRPVLEKRFGSAATALALAVSAIWAWHPVQTGSVTYLSQRAESLMGLCYLLTLYCFVRGVETSGKLSRRIWFSLSVLACLAGVGTKEVIVTAPLIVFLYDRTFISGRFRDAARRHWPLYATLAATWLPLGYLMRGLNHRAVGFGQGVVWWEYGLTESRAVVSYLRLSLWPHPLIFDYGAYAATPLSGLWPYVLILTALMAVTVAALRRSPAAGFAACWFFLILAPTSSIIPIAAQPMAENRLYLPLAGVVGFAVLGAFRLVGRRSLAVLAVVAAALGLASDQRNQEYSSEQAIWSDTVAKNPDNARAHNDLGYALMAIPGRLNDAIAQYQEALRLKPNYSEAHSNLGNAWSNLPGRLDDAIAQYDEALRLQPGFAHAYSNRAVAHLKKGDFTRALADCNEALRLNPGFADATCNRADTYAGKGDYDHAIADYNEAIRLNPDFANAYNNLAWLLAACSEDRIRDGRRAEDYARKGCDLTEWKKPDFIDTLAVASAEAGDFGEAIRWENRYLEFDLPKEVAESARQRLSLFAAKNAYHEGRKPN